MHGVSKKTVTLWKQRGWLVMVGDRVDIFKSNAILKKYRPDGIGQQVTGNTPRKPKVTTRPGESAEDAAVRILTARGADMDMDEARRVKENYLALLNQLEYDQKSSLVVEVADVAQAVGAEYAKVRTRLLAIPAEQAPRIHMLKTVTEVQDVLREIVTEALEELTKDGA